MRNIAITFSLLFFSLTLLAGPGSTGTRGGGSIEAAEFSAVAQQLIADIIYYGPISAGGFTLDGGAMKAKFKNTKVWTSSRWLWILNNRVDAINNPSQNWITFGLSAWKKATAGQREQLVLHELIGLTFPNVSDLSYEISSGALSLLHSFTQLPVLSLRCSDRLQDWTVEIQDKVIAVAVANTAFIVSDAFEQTTASDDGSPLLNISGRAGTNQIQMTLETDYNSALFSKSPTNCYDPADTIPKRHISGFINGFPVDGCCTDNIFTMSILR